MRLLCCLVLAAALSCSACAPRQSSPSAGGDEIIGAPPSPDAEVARFIGVGFAGSSATFSNTRLGSVVAVTVGGAYTSALNQPCKQARATVDGRARNLAACQRADGVWTLAPDIFADGVF